VLNQAAGSWRWFAARVIIVRSIAARHAQSADDGNRSGKQASDINRHDKGAFTMRLVKRRTEDDKQRK
jgi:hypothetical protein